MKVTHLLTFFEPSYAGGIQRYAGEIARLQRKAGIDSSILTVALPERRRPPVPADTAAEWKLENEGLPVRSRNAWGIFYRTPFSPALFKDIRTLNTDVIHLHGPSPWLEFALRAMHPEAKLVFTVHNSYPLSTPAERWLSARARSILGHTMASAGAIIVPNRAFLLEIASDRVLAGCGKRVYIVPPGIDHNSFRPLEMQRDASLILFVGHLRREKGLHILIEAMARLPDCHLKILASVSYESNYYKNVLRQASKKLGKRVTFVFNPNHHAMLENYNTAACVVVPSTGLESWNLVLLEAASCGAACVRSALPPLAWANFAATAVPGDAESLSQAIRRALESRPALERAALNAAREYSWERTALETMAVYRSALA